MLTDSLVKIEQTDVMMMTEQIKNIRLTALMGQTEKMDATESMKKTALMPATGMIAEMMMLTGQMVLTESPVNMEWTETMVVKLSASASAFTSADWSSAPRRRVAPSG